MFLKIDAANDEVGNLGHLIAFELSRLVSSNLLVARFDHENYHGKQVTEEDDDFENIPLKNSTKHMGSRV